MSPKLITVIAGVGAGTGAAVARRFAAKYPVVLLARKPENYQPLVDEINGAGGKAIGFSADVGDAASIKNAFAKIEEEFGNDVAAAAAVFNASGGFVRKPFLELSEQEFISSVNTSIHGGFYFSQASLPLLLRGVSSSEHAPSLIFTGATASVKSNAGVSGFATGKFGLRALSSSLAKEFGPKGVHVAHAIIDGVIDIPRTKEWMKDAGPDAKIGADAIADAYWHLHTQPKSAFTWEIDIRPFVEKW
ncbi:NAD(P)-binding protein [Trichodelitschia bisporula]|uniref:NAD(P)-binding protein n=1 Tax=Trichodelitschia bisporula TaxID=703511 RepID=A0A6G1HZA4_9PEZI|nr:NAD(P)-binding protein [Trichodelitschia bisporula]